MGTLNKLIQDYNPNADGDQQVDQSKPHKELDVDVSDQVVQVSDESQGKGHAVSSPVDPLSRKRKAMPDVPTATPDIPVVLHLTLLDHAPALVRYLEATRSFADCDYYAALTHEERHSRFVYHATQVGFFNSLILLIFRKKI